MILTKKDFEHFKNWLNLDMNSIAWEGRFADSFNAFWDSFFKDQIEYSELGERFSYAKKIAKSGPLVSWLNWLFEKFIAFSFIHQDKSVREISFLLGRTEGYVSFVIRDHLIRVYPEYEDLINENFQISNVSSKNLFIKFQDLTEITSSIAMKKGTFEDDILARVEVTLFPDWPDLVKELKKDMKQLKVNFQTMQKKLAFKKQFKFIQDVVILLLVLVGAVFTLKNTNKWYEEYLVNKITLFEPNFFWLDKSLSYQEQDLLSGQDIDLSNEELEELEKIEAKNVFLDEKFESRFDPESDVVVLASVDDVPKTFGEAETEQSVYEENKKGGYRDTLYASSRKKAYRILMTSVEPVTIKDNILPLLEKYGITQVDNVRPGTRIPGGLYFNVHVPSKYLKDFMTKVSSLGEATIFESRSQGGDKPGKNRVFIWIKSI